MHHILKMVVSESDALFANNRASLQGGAIHASKGSVIVVSEHAVVIMENNTAGNEGGGWYISASSIETHANVLIAFRHNAVNNTSGRGGAIFHDDDRICKNIMKKTCFITSRKSSIGKVLEFTGNTGGSGSILYGGLLDICRTNYSGLTGIDFFKQISQYKPSAKAISSDPARLCLCINNTTIDCTTREFTFTKMRGICL